jgi:hypothetical protein
MENCILYYTNNIVPEGILRATLKSAIDHAKDIDAELIITSHYPLASWAKEEGSLGVTDFPKYENVAVSGDFIPQMDNVKCFTVGPQDQELSSIVKQMLFSMKQTEAKNIYMHEHDVFYPPNHYSDLEEPLCRGRDVATVLNHKFLDADGYYTIKNFNFALSRFAGKKTYLVNVYEYKLENDFSVIEPSLKGYFDNPSEGPVSENFEIVEAAFPVLEIRHGINTSDNRVVDWRETNDPLWGNYSKYSSLIDGGYQDFVDKNPLFSYGIANL